MTSYFGNVLPNSLVTANELFGAATVAVANAVTNAITSSNNSSSSSSSISNNTNNNNSSVNSENSQVQHHHMVLHNQQHQGSPNMPVGINSGTTEPTGQFNVQEVNYYYKNRILKKSQQIIIKSLI